MVPIAALLVSLESAWWVEVHQIGFITFQPTVDSLLNIEDGEKNCINLIRSLKMVSCWAAVDCSHCSIEFTIVSKLPVCDVESFRSCKNSKTWTSPNPWFTLVPSLSKCESGKFIGPWHFQQLHDHEKYDTFWDEVGKFVFAKYPSFQNIPILCVSFWSLGKWKPTAFAKTIEHNTQMPLLYRSRHLSIPKEDSKTHYLHYEDTGAYCRTPY
jgi:hypothetical protein